LIRLNIVIPFALNMLSIRSAVSSTLKVLETSTTPSAAVAGIAPNSIATAQKITDFIRYPFRRFAHETRHH
jgi:hypothetical protein